MKLDCKEISISDDELGCTIEFSEEKEEFDVNIKKSVKEILASIKPYILLQRTYGEVSHRVVMYVF